MTRNEKKNDVPNAFFFFSTQSLLVKLMVRTVPSLWISKTVREQNKTLYNPTGNG